MTKSSRASVVVTTLLLMAFVAAMVWMFGR